MELTAEEARMLGCLIEKQRATPDQYPLTTNSLRTACNQKTSRDPIVDYSVVLVDQTMKELRERGLARTSQAAGSRTSKHRHVIDEALRLDDQQLSVMALLMLRGAQTANELLQRSGRLCSFANGADVERTLDHLAGRDEPLVRCIGRASGQRDDRWVQLLCPDLSGEGGDAPEAVEASHAHRHSAPEPASSEFGANAASVEPDEPPRAASLITSSSAPPVQAAVHATEPISAMEAAQPAALVEQQPPSATAVPDGDALAYRVLELEDEVESLRSDLDLLRSEFDSLARQLGV